MSAEPVAATAQHLLLTAERLFAEHGLDGASLRQIAVEAGSANNSAVRYHFGSKEGLVDAILTMRVSQILQRRALLRARVAGDDLRSHVEAHLLPLLELAEDPESSYVCFLEQVERSAPQLLSTQRESVLSQQDFAADVAPLVSGIPEPARALRLSQAQALGLHAAAARERAVRRGEADVPFGLFVSAVVDGFTGWLVAPASEETVRHVARTRKGAGRA